jgi:fermentation-respiration switch protein FrsA (DUF1100 family)
MRLLVILVVIAAVWVGLVYAAQRAVLFPRPPAPRQPPDITRSGAELWRVGPHRDVESFFLPGHDADRPVPVLIATHGNGELADWWIEPYDVVRSWGVSVVLVEYPGYGRSGGRPGQDTITDVMVSVFDRVAAHPDLDAGRVVLHGRSLGGAAACALAAQRPVRAMILESTFTSVRSFARRYGLFGPLVRDPFDNLAVVRDYRGPILILHGRNDAIIPADHARALHAAARDSELELLECGHNDCPPSWERIRTFLVDTAVLAP